MIVICVEILRAFIVSVLLFANDCWMKYSMPRTVRYYPLPIPRNHKWTIVEIRSINDAVSYAPLTISWYNFDWVCLARADSIDQS